MMQIFVALGVIFALVAGVVAPLGYGLYLAFSASVYLGIAVLILEPGPWIIGLVGFFKPDICEKIVQFFERVFA